MVDRLKGWFTVRKAGYESKANERVVRSLDPQIKRIATIICTDGFGDVPAQLQIDGLNYTRRTYALGAGFSALCAVEPTHQGSNVKFSLDTRDFLDGETFISVLPVWVVGDLKEFTVHAGQLRGFYLHTAQARVKLYDGMSFNKEQRRAIPLERTSRMTVCDVGHPERPEKVGELLRAYGSCGIYRFANYAVLKKVFGPY